MDEGIDLERNWGARQGIAMWDENGKRIWTNRKYDIWHCYSLNLDTRKCLWFYYYGMRDNNIDKLFHLVCSRKDGDYVFEPDIDGSDGFAVSRDYRKLFMGGGYDDYQSIYSYDMDCRTETLSNKKRMKFLLDGKEVEFYRYRFSEDKLFLAMDDGTLVVGVLK